MYKMVVVNVIYVTSMWIQIGNKQTKS